MTHTDGGRFPTPPRHLALPRFMDLFGGVYEHSPWIAEAAWRRGLDESHDTVTGLAGALKAVVDDADSDRQLALIRAHPDLAGKAAVRGRLTQASAGEQAGAGIDQCSTEEFERFERCNRSYRDKFGFPFIMAVKGSNRDAILSGFEQRLGNDRATEFARALAEIHKIARFRLEAMAEGD